MTLIFNLLFAITVLWLFTFIVQGIFHEESDVIVLALIGITAIGISFAAGYLYSSMNWKNEAVEIGAAEYKTDKRGGIKFVWTNPQYQNTQGNTPKTTSDK